MSIPYRNIFRAVALRTGQLADAASAAAYDTVYTNATIASALGGVEIPQTEFMRQILASEKRLISFISTLENPTLRKPHEASSPSIADRGLIPPTDASGKEWIGNLTGFFDVATDEPLSEKPVQFVRQIKRLKSSGKLSGVKSYHFARNGDRLEHTVKNAYARGLSWDYTAQIAAYGTNASGASPLAQELEVMWVADVLMNMAQEGWYSGEAGAYAQIVGACESAYRQGVVPQATLPDTTASAEPVKN